MSRRFYQFSRDEIIEINRRTIERLRATKAYGNTTADTAVNQEDSESWLNSPAAKFSREEIREAFIAASRKLKGA